MKNDVVIQMEQIQKTFGNTPVLDGFDLDIRRGVVYGLLGRNGAGKTTAIRILLGLLFPGRGSSQVFAMDSQKSDWQIRQKTGYVAEGQKPYQWMTVGETLWFSAQFYPTWDNAYARTLLTRFELDAGKKIRELSRGMVSKLSLVLALAHRPELMVLDEPTAGLDVLVRREFLETIVEFVEQEGMTVLIASHQLVDMERVVDQIGFLDCGNIKISGTLEDLKNSFRKVKLSFTEPIEAKLQIPGLLHEERSGREILLLVQNFTEESEKAIRRVGAKNIEYLQMNLEDLFAECLVLAR